MTEEGCLQDETACQYHWKAQEALSNAQQGQKVDADLALLSIAHSLCAITQVLRAHGFVLDGIMESALGREINREILGGNAGHRPGEGRQPRIRTAADFDALLDAAQDSAEGAVGNYS